MLIWYGSINSLSRYNCQIRPTPSHAWTCDLDNLGQGQPVRFEAMQDAYSVQVQIWSKTFRVIMLQPSNCEHFKPKMAK